MNQNIVIFIHIGYTSIYSVEAAVAKIKLLSPMVVPNFCGA